MEIRLLQLAHWNNQEEREKAKQINQPLDWQTYSAKSQGANSLGFSRPQSLCCKYLPVLLWNIDNKEINEHSCVLIKIYVKIKWQASFFSGVTVLTADFIKLQANTVRKSKLHGEVSWGGTEVSSGTVWLSAPTWSLAQDASHMRASSWKWIFWPLDSTWST